jgi:uncharacterized protein
MAISMYQASVPVFVQILGALSGVLGKAQTYCGPKKIDPAVLFAARLAPDMFPLSKQVQIASDFAKGATARLAGVDVPSWPDHEKTISDLQERIAKTLDFVRTFKTSEIDGSEERDVKITIAGQPTVLKGQPYLLGFAMPNFYFHATMAYAVLRHNGVELGKRDFVGGLPGMAAKPE